MCLVLVRTPNIPRDSSYKSSKSSLMRPRQEPRFSRVGPESYVPESSGPEKRGSPLFKIGNPESGAYSWRNKVEISEI